MLQVIVTLVMVGTIVSTVLTLGVTFHLGVSVAHQDPVTGGQQSWKASQTCSDN